MRRILRYLFNGLTLLSMLLCVGTVVIWIRCRGAGETKLWYGVTSAHLYYVQIVMADGGVYARVAWDPIPIEASEDDRARLRSGQAILTNAKVTSPVSPRPTPRVELTRLGQTRIVRAWFRSWQIALVFAFVPAFRRTSKSLRTARSARRIRRFTKAGLCIACGYDLRAASSRCPECGSTKVQPRATT